MSRIRYSTLGTVLIRHDPATAFGLLTIALFGILALIGPLIAPYGPYDFDIARARQPPSLDHPFGTGIYGEDILSRVVHGARIDLVIAGSAVLLALLPGGLLGGFAGYRGGRTDEAIMRGMDALQAFPSFILAMAIAATLGPALHNVIIAIALANVPIYARLIRSKILSLRRRPFMLAAVAVGNPKHRIFFVHLIPNSLGPVFVQASLQCGWAILAAAGLSFIGLGLRVPEPEWGVMIGMGTGQIITGVWWIAFFPGLAIMVAVMGFNLVGDGLLDILDPQRRRT